MFTWGQVGAAIRAAKLGFEFSDQQLRRFRQAVVKDVTGTFYNVLAARELVRIAEENVAQRARRLDEVTRRREAGTATDYDVLAAQVELDSAKPAVIRTQNAVRAAREQLRFLLAEPQEVDVEGALAAPVEPVPAYDALLATAFQHRPELGEIDATQGIYGELIKIAGAGNKPRVDFAADWGKRQLGLPSISSTGTAWDFGVYATVPLFDGWRTKGQVAQARSNLASVNIDELKLREGITLEVRTAVDSAREAVALLDALTRPGQTGRAAAVPRRERLRARREDAPRSAGRRAERQHGAREPRRRPARLPAGARQSRLGGRRPRGRHGAARRARQVAGLRARGRPPAGRAAPAGGRGSTPPPRQP